MAKGDLIGHMGCPCCGTRAEVREDKAGKPLMFCRAGCKAQLFTRKPEQVDGLLSRITRAGAAAVETIQPAPAAEPQAAPAKPGFWETMTGVKA